MGFSSNLNSLFGRAVHSFSQVVGFTPGDSEAGARNCGVIKDDGKLRYFSQSGKEIPQSQPLEVSQVHYNPNKDNGVAYFNAKGEEISKTLSSGDLTYKGVVYFKPDQFKVKLLPVNIGANEVREKWTLVNNSVDGDITFVDL